MNIKNPLFSYIIFSLFGIFFISLSLINSEPIYSLLFDLKIEKVLVVNQGKNNNSNNVKTQQLKVKHVYDDKEYIRKVQVDVIAQKFFTVGDSIEISYKVDSPETLKNYYTDWHFFIFMSLAWILLFYILVKSSIKIL